MLKDCHVSIGITDETNLRHTKYKEITNRVPSKTKLLTDKYLMNSIKKSKKNQKNVRKIS